MGFRNIRDFNLALLGKQAWRLLDDPDTLMARLFKARYFPKTSFLEARLGANPSFIWRSIFETQNTIRNNFRWRVGDGKSINIWTQPWLPVPASSYVQIASPP